MNIRTIHGSRTATVSLVGEITEEGAALAVSEIDRLATDLFYPEIVVEITSEGGFMHALGHMIDAFGRYASHGVRIVTRVPMRAVSAAALLASAGETREAAVHATLQYHSAQMGKVDSLTGSDASALGTMLRRTDGISVRRLAERALGAAAPDGSAVQVAEVLSMADRAVLGRLTAALGADACPAARIGALRDLLAQGRGKGDAAPIEALLLQLFDADVGISSTFALELGLIDRVLPPGGSAGRPTEEARTPALKVPEWERLCPGGLVEEGLLRRHVLILGESGSGKTASGVLPLAGALCRLPERLACALVIDPKRELHERLRAAAHPDVSVRLVEFGANSAGINVMGRGVAALRADLEAGRVLTAATRILVRAGGLAPNEELGTLAGRSPSRRDPYWPREGARMAVSVVALALMLMRRCPRQDGGSASGRLAAVPRASGSGGGGEPHFPFDDEEADLELIDVLALVETGLPTRKCMDWPELAESSRWLVRRFQEASAPTSRGSSGMNAVALASWLLNEAFWPVAREPGDSRPSDGLPGERLALDLKRFTGLTDEEDEALRRMLMLCGLAGRDAGRNPHYQGIAGSAVTALSDFADTSVARLLRFGIEPGTAGDADGFLDMPRLVDGELGPTVLVHQPSEASFLAARALKATFFEAVLDSPRRRTNGTGMPLAAYVADEFHRFVTADARHGEQSFLDTCRSFGAACVLACQGVASIRHALAEAGAGSRGDHAIDILMTNTANKLFFRTSEHASLRVLDSIAPHVGDARLTAVRPPSAMRPGECYAALGDGRFERRQLGMLPEGPREERSMMGVDEYADESSLGN